MNGNLIIFSATGSGDFPIRLLSESSCFPATLEDASAISNSTITRKINLKGLTNPKKDLWKAYGWTIIVKNFGYKSSLNDDQYHTWPC